MKKVLVAVAFVFAFVAGLLFQYANDPMNSIYTMEAEVIAIDGYDVTVELENGHVYNFDRSGLEVGMYINVVMHDNNTKDATDDYPVM